ncbi:MAG: Ig-like domain-containing protein, partial [Deltaproteobacteria bacterium]|nr:Ig-like domain-containing protein [Deltaproteobacteria bacterium]
SAPSVVGAAADGVTRLVVRWPVSGPGTATLRVGDENGDARDVGRLGIPGQAPAYTYLPSQAARQVNGSWYVFASYAVPSEFRRSVNDDNLTSRQIRIQAEFAPASGGTLVVSTSSFELVRPPVLLLHGWASSASDWGLDIQQDPRFFMYAHDYGATAQRSFMTNVTVPRRGVERLVRMMHHAGYAATQVTVIGHSMGGILARLHAGNREGNYYRPSNLGQGDFYKLITLYSPHYGSPIACALEQWPALSSLDSSYCANCGAVTDLRSNSYQIAHLPAANVPTHTIAGVGGAQTIGVVLDIGSAITDVFPGSRIAKTIGRVLAAASDLNQFFEPRHDLVVGELSAYGPMQPPTRSAIGFAANPERPLNPIGVHMGVGKQNIVGNDRLLPLLLSTRSSALFSSLPANTTPALPLICGSAAPPPPQMAPAGSLVLSQPQGSIVENNGSARVDLARNNGYQPSALYLVSDVGMMRLPQNGSSFEIPVPLAAVGDIAMQLVSRDSTGKVALSNTVTFEVHSDLMLSGFEASPSFAPLGCSGETFPLLVTGHYESHITRDLSSAASGTTYSSSDPRVATISADGVVRAVRAGSTQITVRNGNFSSIVDVTVAAGWCTLKKKVIEAAGDIAVSHAVVSSCPNHDC